MRLIMEIIADYCGLHYKTYRHGSVTCDIIGNQCPEYEVIEKGKGGAHEEMKTTPPINIAEGKAFSTNEYHISYGMI